MRELSPEERRRAGGAGGCGVPCKHGDGLTVQALSAARGSGAALLRGDAMGAGMVWPVQRAAGKGGGGCDPHPAEAASSACGAGPELPSAQPLGTAVPAAPFVSV